jgi:prepilin-type processing-associated H-X9-DG protein
VNADASWSQLSPKGDSVLFISNRSAWVAPIVKIPRSAYNDLMKQAAISDAKMVGVAISMYVQDYDEKFPLTEQMSGGVVQPYIKDDAVTEGFNYLYPGDGLADIKKPGETAMGYISGPGGRAFVYVDGHVKWVPDSP